MGISFANGKMIAEHPSGLVETFEPDDLELWLEFAKDEESRVKTNLEAIEAYIASLNATI